MIYLYGEGSEQIKQIDRLRAVTEKLDGQFTITENQVRAYLDGAEYRPLWETRMADLDPHVNDLWLIARELLEVLSNADVNSAPEEPLIEAVKIADNLVGNMVAGLIRFV